MTTLKFADTHNMVVFLSKLTKSYGFEKIVDFLNAQPIRYVLTVNPIEQFWSTSMVKTINGEVQLHALVDGKKIIIFEASVRKDLKLEDEEVQRLLHGMSLVALWDDIQAKIDVDHQLAKRLQAQEQEELSDAENATLYQQLLEKRRKHFAAKRAEEQRNKPPTQAQQRKIMCTYLKNMKGKKLKDLKNKSSDYIQKMFDRAFKRVNTFVDFKTDLVEDEEEVTIDVIPLAVKSPRIINWKIHKERKKSYYQIIRADGKSQITFLEDATCADLQAGRKEISPYTTYNYIYAKQEASVRIVGIKSLLNAASITAAHIRVNAA
ncbi:hypothetical protein Tco_1137524 [Tanacetum coccineum]